MEFKLIIKKLNNTLSKKEEELFNQWYNESEKHKNYFRQVRHNYLKDKKAVSIEKGWKEFKRKTSYTRSFNYWALAIAASIAALIAINIFFFRKVEEEPQKTLTAIEAGTDKAVLTLANGSKVILGKGKTFETAHLKSTDEQLIYTTNKDIPPKKIAYNYLSIPRGGQFFVKLSDGTKVWLNSDSYLKYPVEFAGNSRKVELIYGEAYFEVSPSNKNKGANFIVQTREQEVEVLGTQFNIKAYKEENTIATTLVEGNVSVKNNLSGKKIKLPVSHQLLFNPKNTQFEVVSVDISNEISWKDGFFRFREKSLKDIMTALARWYDAEIIFEDESIQHILFNGVFNKSQDIKDILNIIQNTGEATFRIEGKTIHLNKPLQKDIENNV